MGAAWAIVYSLLSIHAIGMAKNRHWLREESAAAIKKYHTTPDGRTERGYSERTAADFIKTYFAADDRREADGKKRQRVSPIAKPENVIEW